MQVPIRVTAGEGPLELVLHVEQPDTEGGQHVYEKVDEQERRRPEQRRARGGEAENARFGPMAPTQDLP